jgi:predicted hydrocarbon binding protein
MHGAIFTELQKFATSAFGAEVWRQVCDEAGVGPRVYLPVATYPDEEAIALVGAASELSGKPAAELLEAFGEYLVAPLLRTYGSLVRPEWRTLDLLEHTESTIHRIVRVREPAAMPPELACERVSPDEVVIRYGSARRLCPLAIGLIRGVAKHYSEPIEIRETACMSSGAPRCEIRARVASC